ncbi:DUF6292 family protein, partial [Streptomyces sp. NPDC059835]|uniref:DUF6292 family protein n=1 Tax=Streptomyces sp. NPDC059835 TaxID=3346967 RepID=UPI003659AAAB
VETSISFTGVFQEQYGGGDCGLHWAGTSGWCFYDVTKEEDYLFGARWLGAGLLPDPRRVAAFVDSFRLDPTEAGSGEKPYYRQQGQDFPALLERMAIYLPTGRTAFMFAKPLVRFDSVRKLAYESRVQDALASSPSSPLTQVHLRQGELDALLHMLEYVEGENRSVLNRHLAADLRARAGQPTSSAKTHTAAVDEAQRRQQARDTRRHDDGTP